MNIIDRPIELKEVELFLEAIVVSGFTGSLPAKNSKADYFYEQWGTFVKRLMVAKYEDNDKILWEVERRIEMIRKNSPDFISYGTPFFHFCSPATHTGYDGHILAAMFIRKLQNIVQIMKGKQSQ